MIQNIVVGTKNGGYVVKYPYQDQFDFYASTPEALIDALNSIKSAYQPKVYELQTWYSKPRLKVLTKKNIENWQKSIAEYKKFKSK